jgi:hypothetical protein
MTRVFRRLVFVLTLLTASCTATKGEFSLVNRASEDGDLALWDDHKAFVLTNGVWHKAEAFTMWDNARVNVPESFMRKLIAEAPPLPDRSFAHG